MQYSLTTILKSFGIASAAVVVLSLPSYASAANTATSTTRPDTSVRGVCLRVVTLENDFKQKISDAQAMYAKSANDRASKLRSLASQRSLEDLGTRRASDEKFKKYVDSLRASAQNDVLKEGAIDGFAMAVTNATTQRRSSVDAAQKTFVTGIQSLVELRSREVGSAALMFQNDVSSAFTQAKTSCESGQDPEAVRDSLHTALTDIDQRYKVQFADQHTLAEGLEGLVAARTGALLAAAASFSASLDSASQALHIVLQ